MSRRIVVSDCVIQQPELLTETIEFLNEAKNYSPVELALTKNNKGEITGGTITMATPQNSYARGFVYLQFVAEKGESIPRYKDEKITNGHFEIRGDEDYRENKDLGTRVGDAYNATVTKRGMEELGHRVHLEWEESGAARMDIYEAETGLAACNY